MSVTAGREKMSEDGESESESAREHSRVREHTLAQGRGRGGKEGRATPLFCCMLRQHLQLPW